MNEIRQDPSPRQDQGVGSHYGIAEEALTEPIDVRPYDNRQPSEAFLEDMFNFGVVAHAIAAADQLGLFQHLATGQQVRREDLQRVTATPYLLPELLKVLEFARIVETRGDLVRVGRQFESALTYRSFFTWLFGGCGRTLAAAGGDDRHDIPLDVHGRDRALVGLACGQFGAEHIDPYLLEIPELRDGRVIADLGCGDGSRAARMVEHLGVRVIGIDISGAALARARQMVSDRRPLDSAISLIQADVRSLVTPRQEFRTVEALVVALLGHDLWPFEECVRTLDNWRTAFPNAHTLVMCETVSAESFSGMGIPSLGYEYVHGAMAQRIPSLAEWREAFRQSDWALAGENRLEIPANTIVFVCHPG